MITIPPYLQPGNTIGLICPAGYMAAEKVQTCIQTLQQWGYQVKAGSTIGGNSTNYFSGTDEERLKDLQQMLDDDNIHAVMCARGGYGTTRIIDDIDFKKFKKNPKWIIGYSDITALLTHLYAHYKIAGLHSPMAAAFNDGGAQNEFVLSLKKALAGEPSSYNCNPHPLNTTGKAEGPLLGGNLSLLATSIGTASDIKTKGKILFVEDIGEQLYSIDRMFRQLKRSGKLDKLAGLIIGKFVDTKDTDRPFGKPVYDVINDIIKDYNYPVCYEFPVSHSDENYALKTGVQHQLIVKNNKVQLKESVE